MTTHPPIQHSRSSPTDPVVDPAMIAAVTPVVLPVVVPVETPEPAAAAQDDKALPLVAVPIAATEEVKPVFDPEADPLDAMPAVRLAMEQGGHVSASSQAPAKTAPTTTQDQRTAAQNFRRWPGHNGRPASHQRQH